MRGIAHGLMKAALYWGVMIGLGLAGAFIIRVGYSLGLRFTGYEAMAWTMAAILISALLSAISLILRPIENAAAISHFEGTSDGNSVSLSPVTQGESSWKWRTGLIFILTLCSELWLQGELSSTLSPLIGLFASVVK